MRYIDSADCDAVAGTRTLKCNVGSVVSGASVTKRFVVDARLLAIGRLVSTVERTASSPTDPAAANDKATRTCSALTGLLVRC